MFNYVTLLKIHILRHLVCDVTFSPLPIAPRGGGGNDPPVGLKTVHVHDTGTSGVMTSLPVGKNAANLQEFTIMTSLPVCDVTSGRETCRKPARYYNYDAISCDEVVCDVTSGRETSRKPTRY